MGIVPMQVESLQAVANLENGHLGRLPDPCLTGFHPVHQRPGLATGTRQP